MIYIISLEDGGGREFFLNADGEMTGMATGIPSSQLPQEFSSYRTAAKKLDVLRTRYPPTCQLYAMEKAEFDQRSLQLRTVFDEVSNEEQTQN